MGFEEPSKILPQGKSLSTQSTGPIPEELFKKKRDLYLLLLVRRFPVDKSKTAPYIQWKTPVDNSQKPVDKSGVTCG